MVVNDAHVVLTEGSISVFFPPSSNRAKSSTIRKGPYFYLPTSEQILYLSTYVDFFHYYPLQNFFVQSLQATCFTYTIQTKILYASFCMQGKSCQTQTRKGNTEAQNIVIGKAKERN